MRHSLEDLVITRRFHHVRPARSVGLNHYHFWLSGYIKQFVGCDKLSLLPDLEDYTPRHEHFQEVALHDCWTFYFVISNGSCLTRIVNILKSIFLVNQFYTVYKICILLQVRKIQQYALWWSFLKLFFSAKHFTHLSFRRTSNFIFYYEWFRPQLWLDEL